MSGRTVPALATLAAVLGLVGCTPQPELVVRDAWVRAVPPGASATAGYLVLENRGERERVLAGVSASGTDRVEMHATRMADGVMRMRRLPEIRVPAGASVELAPGGYHLMIFADTLPAADTTVTLELRFADGTVIAVDAPVGRGARD